jgi:hypothetical protein
LIRKLVTITAAITCAIIAAVAAAIIAAITTITAAVIAAITATVDTARRRSTAGRRRRRSIDLAAATAPVIAAAPIPDGTIAEATKCFGLGRNGGGSECESCRGHDGYPAEFEHHDTSPVIYLAVSPHLDCSLPTETSNKAQPGISERLSRHISRYG